MAKLAAKPMSMDPIFWDIMKMSENRQKPLSFRAWAAFRCYEPEFTTTDLDCSALETEQTATKIMSWATQERGPLLSNLKTISFADHLMQTDQFKTTGYYGPQVICALISEDRVEDARQTLEALMSDPERSERSGFSSAGRSFYDLAIEYLKGL